MTIINRILEILRKDKNVLTTLLIVPLIVPFFLHFVYGQIYVENIPFAIADMDNSSLSRSIAQGFENHPGLDVCYYVSSENELEDLIMRKKICGGMLIPKGLSKDLAARQSPKVALIVDGTNIMIGNNAAGYASAVLGTFNAGIQMKFMEGNGMPPSIAQNTMTTFSYSDRVLYEPFLSYICNLVYIIIPFLLQTYFLTTLLLPACVEEKHYWIHNDLTRAQKRNRIGFLTGRILLSILSVCVASYLAFVIYANLRNMPLRGTFGKYAALLAAFLLALSAISLVLTAFFNEKNLIYFIEFYFIISSVIIITSGAVWPEYMMPGPLAAAIKSFWPFFHVALPMKYINLKGVGWDMVLPSIGSCLIYFLIWFPAGLFLLRRKIRILREKERGKAK